MLKEISVADLRLGMYIHKFAGSWIHHPFFHNKFLLDDSEDLIKIQHSKITHLIIDTSKGFDIQSSVAAPTTSTLRPAKQPKAAQTVTLNRPTAATPKPTPIVNMQEEVKRAAKICAHSKEAVIDMFNDARMGRAIKTEKISLLVEEMANSMSQHPGALISVARLKNADEYTYMHSVAVSALMIALARELKLEEALVHEAGVAGLLHDLGKVSIDDNVLNKPGRLTDEEFSLVKKHPELGYEILRQTKDTSELARDVCLHHHEKFDGTGYPHQLAGEDIHLLARMAAICDVYDAITSNRPYKKGWDPAESIRRMADWTGHFDPHLFQAFVKTIGIYPVGALVRLQSERLAIVIEQHPDALLMPKVRVFFSTKNHGAILPEEVDLSQPNCDDKIIGREPLSNWNFTNLDELWIGHNEPIW